MDKFNPEYVFHLAAQPLVLESYKNPQETFDIANLPYKFIRDINEGGYIKMVLYFIQHLKFSQNLELGVPFVESDNLGGKDPYSASKAASEILIEFI